jgi:hypothetical protein
MERLETEQPIFQSTDVLGKEPQSGFVDPSVIGSPNLNQTGQSSLPELGPELVPIDASHLLSGSSLFNDPLRSQVTAAVEPYLVTPGTDPLTGLSLNLNPSASNLPILQDPSLGDNAAVDSLLNAEASTKATLQTFFKQPDWQQTFEDIFGKDFNQARAQELATAFSNGDFSALPPIEILSAAVMSGARGGFDTGAGKIYLSDALLNGDLSHTNLVKSVLLEEIGHYIDAQVNQNDTTGDEGEYFADRLQGLDLSNADLLRIKTEDDHATIWLNGAQHLIEQATTLPNFAIRTQGTLRMNGGGDLDGDPLNLQDDALVYAAKGFTFDSNAILPIQYNANGTPMRDASGKILLVPDALSVSPGYTSSQGPSNKYAGLNPPAVISPQTVDLPLYSDLLNQTLTRRVPNGTAEIIFNAKTPLKTASDWATKFPAGGTATLPKVVHVINGGLNIPSNAILNNLVIKVDNGSITFNGSGQTLNNVVLITNNGNITLKNTNATNLAVFASGSITATVGTQLAGDNLFATGTTKGNITFSGSTKTAAGNAQLQVIAQGNVCFKGASNTRGNFLSAGTITFDNTSTLYGSIAAKGNITFKGKTTVVWAPIHSLNQAPTNLVLSSSSVVENSLASSVIGTLSTADPDTNNTFTYSLVTGTGDIDNTVFSVAGNQLKINTSPDFEAKSSYSVRVRTTDQGGLSYDQAFTVSITNLNEAPTDIALSITSIPENTPIGTIIGTLSATDPDQNDTQQYSLVPGTGATDNVAFAIVGNQLQLQTTPNFATHPSYSIRVKATDAGGLSTEKVLSLTVLDTTAPLIQAGLAQDTAPNGQTNTDTLTSEDV